MGIKIPMMVAMSIKSYNIKITYLKSTVPGTQSTQKQMVTVVISFNHGDQLHAQWHLGKSVHGPAEPPK